jgi:hypothetical protein
MRSEGQLKIRILFNYIFYTYIYVSYGTTQNLLCCVVIVQNLCSNKYKYSMVQQVESFAEEK